MPHRRWQADTGVDPHHRKRNNSEPSRSSQSSGMFAYATDDANPKVDRRTLARPRLKRGPRLCPYGGSTGH
jgi:hypothetical protein